MIVKQFYHLCADGAVSKGFILNEKDYRAAMNIIAVCAANSEVIVVAFCLEDTHPHFLLFGALAGCVKFKQMLETTYRHYAASTRGGESSSVIDLEIFPIGNDMNYLRNVAVYVINQPTKDRKRIMPYDYPWGSGPLYFRSKRAVPVWLCDGDGNISAPVPFSKLHSLVRREMIHTRKYTVPEDWLVADGILLPSNYVDVALFESIYQTHNSFRVFLAGSRAKDDEIRSKMAEERGIQMEDLEARQICGNESNALYNTRNTRLLDSRCRLALAQVLRRKHRLTYRQIATLVYLPEAEVRRSVAS